MVDTKKIMLLVQKLQQKIADLSGDIVLVLGPTGSGKSTLINYLQGNELLTVYSDTDATTYVKVTKKKFPGPVIGQTSNSETQFPGLYRCDKPYQFCDTAGLFDTKGPEERLLAVKAIQKILQSSVRVKAIYVVMEQNTVDAVRGTQAAETLEMLAKIFPGDEYYKHNIQYVFTKADGRGRTLEQMGNIVVRIIREKLGLQYQKMVAHITAANFSAVTQADFSSAETRQALLSKTDAFSAIAYNGNAPEILSPGSRAQLDVAIHNLVQPFIMASQQLVRAASVIRENQSHRLAYQQEINMLREQDRKLIAERQTLQANVTRLSGIKVNCELALQTVVNSRETARTARDAATQNFNAAQGHLAACNPVVVHHQRTGLHRWRYRTRHWTTTEKHPGYDNALVAKNNAEATLTAANMAFQRALGEHSTAQTSLTAATQEWQTAENQFLLSNGNITAALASNQQSRERLTQAIESCIEREKVGQQKLLAGKQQFTSATTVDEIALIESLIEEFSIDTELTKKFSHTITTARDVGWLPPAEEQPAARCGVR